MKAKTTGRTGRLACAAQAFLTRFATAVQGNVAMMFGLALPVLLMIVLGAIDLHQASKVKAQLQDALDAAALAAARSSTADAGTITSIGMAALKANMPGYFQVDKDGKLIRDQASFVLTNKVVVAEARVEVKVLVANIFLPPYGKLLDDYLPVGTRSEVLRASRNVEVAMALDITGSMDNCKKNCPPSSKLEDLQAAAKELIDLVVQDQQSPFYSKVALVPYAAGVNLDSSAAAVRGALDTTTTSISAASWLTGSIRTVSSISSSSNATVTTSSNHGFVTGDRVVLWRVNNSNNNHSMRVLNGVPFYVERVSNTQFRVKTVDASGAMSSNLNTSSYSSYSGTAYVAKCVRNDCGLVLTASGHGLTAGGYVRLESMGGLSQLNSGGYRIASVSGSQLILDTSRSLGLAGSSTPQGGTTYSSGGKVATGADGGRWRVFPSATTGGMVAVLDSSTCVSERAGSQAYTDAAPSTGGYVGRSYLESSNPCPTIGVTPLSIDRTVLHGQIDKLVAGGSTAGQIGIAWAWYMVSPHFASLWNAENRPSAYNPAETLKVAILMTDGEFNTPFKSGVIALNAGDGSGSLEAHINENSANGDPFSQSLALCRAMKAQGVIIYTVGFDLSSSTGGPGDDTAVEVLQACATNKDTHFFKATNGTDLKEAFRSIGRDITRLRIAR
ncbi:pilus assembly protein TadG-related protein [Brevundimonas faecalis]|uniref:Flp pilus assembly protein TadG n=1 Tax=Brevundimonas faecalis TaxID=947378 RepID=A0ABV2RFF4_9CAUL